MDKVTIIDLGMTKPFTAYGKMKRLTSLCGTDGYAAPEIRPPYTDYEGGNSDLWSCGAILHFLVFLKDPFASIKGYYATTEDRPVLFTEKEKGFPYFDGYDSAEHLMKKMLQKLPENRYTWSDVIDHSWLEEYRPFFVRKYISLSESQSNPMPENEKHLLSEITMDESVNNTTILKMMSEAELPNNNHKTTMERIRKLKLKDLNIERLGTNESPQTSNESVQSSIEMLSVNQAEGSSQCNVMRVSKCK
jgi:serine/threonine protein kinase